MAEIGETESAAQLIPNAASRDELRDAAAECTACPLYQNATQTVFGEGPQHAAIISPCVLQQPWPICGPATAAADDPNSVLT